MVYSWKYFFCKTNAFVAFVINPLVILITALNDLNRQDQALAGTAYECIHTQVNNLTKHYCDKKSDECIQKWNECQQFYQTLLCYKLDKKQPIGQSDLSCDFSRLEMFHICLINSYRSTRTNMISVGRDQKNIGNGPISRSVADSAKCRVNVGFTTLLITAFFLFSNIFSSFFFIKGSLLSQSKYSGPRHKSS